MIVFNEGFYFMREAYCKHCKDYHKTVAITDKYPYKCIYCRTNMQYRWVNIGKKLDYGQYFSKRSQKRMARGKND
jgi:hypothetical protein